MYVSDMLLRKSKPKHIARYAVNGINKARTGVKVYHSTHEIIMAW